MSRLTREEREEMYKVARERIFGSSEDSTTGSFIAFRRVLGY